MNFPIRTQKLFPVPEWIIRHIQEENQRAALVVWLHDILRDYAELALLTLQCSKDEQSLEIARRAEIEYHDGVPYIAIPHGALDDRA